MRNHRGISALFAAGVMIAGCHGAIAPSSPAAISDGESACWWTLVRTAVPPDSVAVRFKSAYATLGLQDIVSSGSADTTTVVARPSLGEGANFGSRVVAYRQGDSTSLRFYVEAWPARMTSKATADTPGSRSDELESCSTVARAAGIKWSTPRRRPNGQDSLPVWQDRSFAQAPGIEFGIDSSQDRGPAAGVFKMFAGHVTFARNRGRLDVIARSESRSVRVAGAVIDVPRGNATDYYLFDSAGFALVRPATKTYSVSSISEESLNYEERRDGWPDAFEFAKPRVDTLSPSALGSTATQYKRLPIFWHLDLEQSPVIRVLARGRMVLDDAPVGEATIARWFGAASALAHMPGAIASVAEARLRVTAVIVAAEKGDRSPPVNLVVLHGLSTVGVARIDPNRLAVPSDYVEIPWRSTVGVDSTNSATVSSAQSMHWKSVP